MVLEVVLGALAALLVLWLALLVGLWLVKPEETRVRDATRLLPDTVRLLARLARAPELPWRTRLWLWLLLGYLAMPLDLVPDVIPVIGYADDAVLVLLALRVVTRRAGEEVLRRSWPGTDEGLAVVLRLAGLR